jgi:preprotein translocase subunit SecE
MATKKSERPKKSKAVTEAQTEKKSFSLDQVRTFIEEVKSEFGKIVWPEKKVTIGSTGVVIVLVLIIAIYLGAVDLFVGKLVTYILR